jgi:hypothetical protein
MRWSMGGACLWDYRRGTRIRHIYERHANGMAPLRDTPMRYPMRDAGPWEMYAYEIAVYGIYAL